MKAVAANETIRSRQNARLKDLRRRLRQPEDFDDGRIAIEGLHLVEEALRSNLRIDAVFICEDRLGWTGSLRISSNTDVFPVAADAFNHACATESPQGIAALVEAPQWSLDDLLRIEFPRLVILAGLQDPGNVGTVIRTAEAFAATGVLLTPPNVSPWNQKLLRASAGSSFRLPVIALDSLLPLEQLRKRRIPLYACDAQAKTSMEDIDFRSSWAFAIGNEGAGLPEDIRRLCMDTIHIPCPGPVESLNAATAAAIVLYEAARQIRHLSPGTP